MELTGYVAHRIVVRHHDYLAASAARLADPEVTASRPYQLGEMTCIYVGVKNVRLFEEIILLHGGIPVGCDFLSRDIAGYRATGATIKIVTYVPIIPIIERVRVRQMIGP